MEARAHGDRGQSDPEWGIGAGPSTAHAGLRVRYELRREFAPYVGVTWHREFLGTAHPGRDVGDPTRGAHLTVGVRFWLFYVIEHGVPFTGMPAWSTGTGEGTRESWELVLFVRHLPRITADEIREMERLNPKSVADLEAERRIQEFLKGGGR